jgi:preprotein translocase subunit SecA
MVTVNDYLAKRDAEWMSVWRLGPDDWCDLPQQPEAEENAAYRCDVICDQQRAWV